jgi:hypothetical protein
MADLAALCTSGSRRRLAEGVERGPRGAEGERRVALDGRDLSPMHEGRVGTQPRVKERRSPLHMAGTSMPRVLLWCKNANRWRAVKWTVWSSNLGLIWADLGLGPKTKVEAHTMLYIFYLKVMVISVVD